MKTFANPEDTIQENIGIICCDDLALQMSPKYFFMVLGGADDEGRCELFSMLVEPLPGLAVGVEAVTRRNLGGALEWRLVVETG